MFSFRILYLLFSVVVILASRPCSAQLSIGSSANSLVIKSGETFNYEGLSLTPSSDFSLSNTTLTRTDAKSISPTPGVDYIARYFSFSNTTPAFSGSIRFSYLGATLSPLTAGSLELNIRTNGTSWVNISGTDVNASSYVEVTGVTNRTLNTLTLASNIAPLPVNWLQFTAVKKDHAAVLTWVTSAEYGAQDYVVQHSSAGGWEMLGVVKAAGNSATPLRYSYTHAAPSKGHNYYRIMQRDRDGKQSYSGIATVWIGDNNPTVNVFPNPVQNHRFTVTITRQGEVNLFDATGRRVLSQNLKEGSHLLDVSGLQSGVYSLRTGSEVLPLIIP